MNKLGENIIGRLQLHETSIRFIIEKLGDERFRVYALHGKQTIYSNPYKIDEFTPSYLSFCIHNNTLKFSGMYVAPHFRGSLMSDYLMSLLFQISEELEIPLSETSVIRKPIMAKKLIEWGFIAKIEDTKVELTGQSQGILKIPIVKNIQDISGKLKHNMSRLSQNIFYILEEQEGTGEIIPIHTQFLFQDIEKSHKKIELLTSDIDGKRRFYRSKVKKILGK